jgi:hypothetical protein
VINTQEIPARKVDVSSALSVACTSVSIIDVEMSMNPAFRKISWMWGRYPFLIWIFIAFADQTIA